MNHAAKLARSRMVRPHAALVTTIAPVHIEYLGSIEAIADAKAEISLASNLAATAALNRDAPNSNGSRKRQAARGARVLISAAAANATRGWSRLEPIDSGSHVKPRILGRESSSSRRARRPYGRNALGALLAAEALGADLDACAARAQPLLAQKGRGARFSVATR